MSRAPDAYLSYLHHRSWSVACDHIAAAGLTGILRRPQRSDDHILRIMRMSDSEILWIASTYDTPWFDSQQAPLWSVTALMSTEEELQFGTKITLPRMPYMAEAFEAAQRQLREIIDRFAAKGTP